MLSGYGSDSSSESDSDDANSDTELKASLSSKRKKFKKLESDILDFVEDETIVYKNWEKNWLRSDKHKNISRSPSNDSLKEGTQSRESSSRRVPDQRAKSGSEAGSG